MDTTHDRAQGFSLLKIMIVVGLLGALLVIIPSIRTSNEVDRLKAEINRVSEQSGIEPSSVSCRNVELANICYAEYGIARSKAATMLTGAGYQLEGSTSNQLSGKNTASSVRVDGERSSSAGVMTIKYKDIDVTL